MKRGNPISDISGWVIHRLTANYWSLALGAVALAVPVFVLALHGDRSGLTELLLAHDLSPVATADTARDLAGVMAGINAAFLTLYYSISLIVLTIAAGNLGVRLIDRWLGKRLVRVSIAGLSFTLVFALLTMASIDPEADLASTPLATFAMAILLFFINVIMLAVAVHDLGRTMFVDKAIDALAGNASTTRIEVVGKPAFQGEFAQRIEAPRNGYIEGVDLDRIEKFAGKDWGIVRVCVAPGQHVLRGETLIALEHQGADGDKLLRCVPIGPFRSNSQGAVFQIRLLVEIAARALSPAVNDFYTAIAAADALAEVIGAHCDNFVDPSHTPVSREAPQIELPGQDFVGLFSDPLAAFRQAAAPYPSVSIRMIGNLGRVLHLQCDGQHGARGFLTDYAVRLHAHARTMCETDYDRASLDDVLEKLLRDAA